MTSPEHEITSLLREWSNGEKAAFDRLLPLVYRELHKIARSYMISQNPGQTLQTTAIVHEAYLKLAAASEHDWQSRAHFFGVAAKAMRHVLVDRARARASDKRGRETRLLPLDEAIAVTHGKDRELISLDDALTALAKLHPRKGQVVELRYFAGLSVDETAKILKISPETVARDWQFPKAFLQREITHATPSRGG